MSSLSGTDRSSAADDLALYRNVTDADLRGRDDCYIVEGPRIVERFLVAAAHAPATIHPLSVLLGDEVAASPAGARIRSLAERRGGDGPAVRVHVRPQDEVVAIAGYRLHHGALALGRRLAEPTLPALLSAPPRTILCLDRVVHTDNMGSIFRTAGSLGDVGVFLSADSSDPLLRKSIRVSSGRVFCTPWARSEGADAWSTDLHALRAAGYRLIAAEHDPRAVSPSALSLHDHGRVAFVIGAEGDGLPRATLDACDAVVEIPMRASGGALADDDHPSLNAAVAAAMLLGLRL